MKISKRENRRRGSKLRMSKRENGRGGTKLRMSKGEFRGGQAN